MSPLSPSPPQQYLGPREDGPEEVDEPELELVGELPAGLEALCKDKGRWRRLGQVAKKKAEIPFSTYPAPKPAPGSVALDLVGGKGAQTPWILAALAAGGEFFVPKPRGFVLKSSLVGIHSRHR